MTMLITFTFLLLLITGPLLMIIRIGMDETTHLRVRLVVEVLMSVFFLIAWVAVLRLFAAPDPYVQGSPISIFFMTLFFLLFGFVWYTKEVRTEYV